MISRSAQIGSLVALVLLALVPTVVHSSYWLHVFIIAFVFVVVVAAWDLITGYAGIFSFGQIAFFAIGAYTSGILVKDWSWEPWLAMAAAGLLSAVAGVAIALPCLRIRGAYIAVVTYALALVLPTVILQGKALGTGGTAGLLGVPGLRLGDRVLGPLDKVPYFYVGLVFAAVCIYVIYFRIIRSDFGLGMTALRDAEAFAKSLGVNEYRTKILVFAYSAFFTGLAGSLYVHYTGTVSQRILGLEFFLLIMMMLTVGGMARYPGALIGTFVFAFSNEFLRISGSMRQIITGGIIIAAVLILPGGFVQLADAVAARWRWRASPQFHTRRRRVSTSADVQRRLDRPGDSSD